MDPAAVPGFFSWVSYPWPKVMLFLHNLPARLAAVPAHGPRPVDPWTVARVPYPWPRGPWPAILDLVARDPGPGGPRSWTWWPAILDLVARDPGPGGPGPLALDRPGRWPWTGRAGGQVARYLVRA
jgi:hypothetical protein